MKKRQENRTLLVLEYERQVSRAHTIFSAFWDIFFGLIVGSVGIIIGFIEIGLLEFNPFSFSVIVIFLLLIVGVVASFAYYHWNQSRIIRKNIEEELRNFKE